MARQPGMLSAASLVNSGCFRYPLCIEDIDRAHLIHWRSGDSHIADGRLGRIMASFYLSRAAPLNLALDLFILECRPHQILQERPGYRTLQCLIFRGPEVSGIAYAIWTPRWRRLAGTKLKNALSFPVTIYGFFEINFCDCQQHENFEAIAAWTES
jgi:hypothetical protein